MKKNRLIKGLLGLAIIIISFALGMIVQSNKDHERTALRSLGTQKENAVSEEGLINLVPGTTADMLSADFWKREDADTYLLTPEEIKAFNENNPVSLQYYELSEDRNLRLFTDKLPEEIEGTTIQTLLDPEALRGFEKDAGKYYVNGAISTKDYWETLWENCGYENVQDKVKPVYCIATKRDMARAFPTEDFVSADPEEIYCNDLVAAEVMPLAGVAALHESEDGQWVFVICGSYCGWVKKESLATCKDKEQWSSFLNPEEFLVVTGCEITLDDTAMKSKASGLTLPMGTKIGILRTQEAVDGRHAYGNYVAEIPVRGDDGALELEKVLIPLSKDVTVGYLPMTSGKVLEQAFKFLGKVYGWGGSLSSNDCSGIVRQVYACFGLELPRNSAAIVKIYDLGGREFSDATKEKKLELMKKLPAGTLLYMNGHLMIYLGMEGDKPYVISSCATFIAPGDKTKTIQDAYSVFVSDLDLLRKNGKTWLESITYFQWREY